jgi:hypothetical protein
MSHGSTLISSRFVDTSLDLMPFFFLSFGCDRVCWEISKLLYPFEMLIVARACSIFVFSFFLSGVTSAEAALVITGNPSIDATFLRFLRFFSGTFLLPSLSKL